MVIRVRDAVSKCATFEDGVVLRGQIESALSQSATVEVSFEGVFAVSSSFVNGAFVRLLDSYDLKTVRKRLRIVQSTPLINDLIKSKLKEP